MLRRTKDELVDQISPRPQTWAIYTKEKNETCGGCEWGARDIFLHFSSF
jgi:hypothetical protein